MKNFVVTIDGQAIGFVVVEREAQLQDCISGTDADYREPTQLQVYHLPADHDRLRALLIAEQIQKINGPSDAEYIAQLENHIRSIAEIVRNSALAASNQTLTHDEEVAMNLSDYAHRLLTALEHLHECGGWDDMGENLEQMIEDAIELGVRPALAPTWHFEPEAPQEVVMAMEMVMRALPGITIGSVTYNRDMSCLYRSAEGNGLLLDVANVNMDGLEAAASSLTNPAIFFVIRP